MLNYLILVKGIIKMTKMVNTENLIELCMRPMGVRLNLALQKDNLFGDPGFKV